MAIDEQWDERGLVGTILDRTFEVVRVLSATPRSDVFEAQHVKLAQRVAVKVLRDHPLADALRERAAKHRMLERFDHAGIVDVTAIGKLDNDAPYLVCELVRGESLGTLLKRGALAPGRALAIARQILEALAVAHERGASHRCLDPEHVMIARGDNDSDLAKVLGVGLAQLVPDDAARLANPNYMPPERAYGPRADLYVVGAILFEMLTGYPPFHTADASALLRLHAYASVPTLKQRAPNRTFTPETEAVVARALIKAPEARFPTAREMIAALDVAARAVDAADAEAFVPPPSEPRPSSDESLAVLARDFRAANAKPDVPPPIMPTNVGREVRALTWSMRARKLMRSVGARVNPLISPIVSRFRRLDRRYQLALGGVAVLVVIVLVVALHPKSRATATAHVPISHVLADDVAVRSANELLDHHLPKNAMAILAAKVAAGTRANPLLLGTLSRALDSGDAEAALRALDVLSRLVPVPTTLVAAQASTAPAAAVRHRAVAVAEAHGGGGQIDRVASWSLDLAGATACTEQRALIAKLAATSDRRAIPALRKAQASSCVAADASAAIAKLERGG